MFQSAPQRPLKRFQKGFLGPTPVEAARDLDNDHVGLLKFGFEFELECKSEFAFELELKFSSRSKMRSKMVSK